MPEQRKRLHCVAEITLSTTFLLASEVPAIAAFARSGLHQKRNFKTHASGYQNGRDQKLIWLYKPKTDTQVGGLDKWAALALS